MIWVWVLVIVAVVGTVVLFAAGRDESLGEVYDDRPDTTIATGRLLTADDLRDVRLSTAVRGYRMDEVDSLLRRVEADLRAREREDGQVEGGLMEAGQLEGGQAEKPRSASGDDDAGGATVTPLGP